MLHSSCDEEEKKESSSQSPKNFKLTNLSKMPGERSFNNVKIMNSNVASSFLLATGGGQWATANKSHLSVEVDFGICFFSNRFISLPYLCGNKNEGDFQMVVNRK